MFIKFKNGFDVDMSIKDDCGIVSHRLLRI